VSEDLRPGFGTGAAPKNATLVARGLLADSWTVGALARRFDDPGRALGVAAAAILAVTFATALLVPSVRPNFLLRDFNAFYCAGYAIDHGADPYRAEPLGACERRPRPEGFAAGTAGLAMPAPLPPYALAPFAMLARLPYLAAGALWTMLLLAALALAVLAMRRLTDLPWPALVAAYALTGAYAGLSLGQVAPLAAAAIALAALFAARGCDRAAGWAAACAMLEPHIGLPACLALFIFRPGARLPLAAGAAACVATSLALVGPHVALEYARAVLPAHALSEIANEKQLSLTYILHRAGVADVAALRIGETWYLAMVALGIAAAGLLRRRSGALLVALPAAAALFGGPFVHVVQMSAALPAALVAFQFERGPKRTLLGVAIMLLAVPWLQFVSLGSAFAVLAGIALATLAATLLEAPPPAVVAWGLGGFAAVAGLWMLIVTAAPHAEPALLAAYDPHALAEASWTLYVRTVATTNPAAFDLAKLPTWFALGAVLYVAGASALRYLSTGTHFALASSGKGSPAPQRTALR
jgi:hypothetical protein